ncbi:MAG: hypothetical protein LQ352_007946 [Teloschistes flavicans]|nr:MAG: hypothetical protein LQ352_007946 [Teloschistes flavicans]
MTSSKSIHTIILDAGPMLKNDPPIPSLLAKADRLVTVAAVISEIRDATARSRIETTWKPFLEISSPSSQSLKLVTDFARKTGDLAVLSRPDLDILALTYEFELQKNGSSHIRTVPGQKLEKDRPVTERKESTSASKSTDKENEDSKPIVGIISDSTQSGVPVQEVSDAPDSTLDTTDCSDAVTSLHISEDTRQDPLEPTAFSASTDATNAVPPPKEDSESDADGWITPSNIQKHQAKDAHHTTLPISPEQPLDVACMTTDFAMQNVLLSMNLSLLSPSLHRVRNIKTFILRCHACFSTTKDMTKQFCPRCGKPTLTRVSCSTNSKGEFRLHLKKNMQWNHRGDRFSIPKPVSGTASGKSGGGKGGWGQGLILAEDQKEYLKAVGGQRRRTENDLMDETFLPGILTGERGGTGGGARPKIGAGRNVNSKKR